MFLDFGWSTLHPWWPVLSFLWMWHDWHLKWRLWESTLEMTFVHSFSPKSLLPKSGFTGNSLLVHALYRKSTYRYAKLLLSCLFIYLFTLFFFFFFFCSNGFHMMLFIWWCLSSTVLFLWLCSYEAYWNLIGDLTWCQKLGNPLSYLSVYCCTQDMI